MSADFSPRWLHAVPHIVLHALWTHLGRPLAAIGAGLTGALPPTEPVVVEVAAHRSAPVTTRGRRIA